MPMNVHADSGTGSKDGKRERKNNPTAIRVTCAILGTFLALVPVVLLVGFWSDIASLVNDPLYSGYAILVVVAVTGGSGLLSAYLLYLATRKQCIVRRRYNNAPAFKILSGAGISACVALAVLLVVFFRHDIAGYYDATLNAVVAIAMIALVMPFAAYYAFGIVRKQKTRKAVAYSAVTLGLLLGMTVGLAAFQAIRHVPGERGPYLSWSADPRTSMTVSWQSPAPGPRGVEWSTTSTFAAGTVTTIQAGETDLQDVLLRYYYNATITGLSPATTFWYRIPGFHDTPSSFTTAPNTTVPFSFFAYGDNREATIVGSEHPVVVKLMHDLHQETRHSFVVNSGDIANDWDTVHSWDIHFHAIKPLASTMPYLIGTGNHEWRSKAGDWEQPHNLIHEVPPGHLNKSSFAYQYSNAYFIFLGYGHAQGEQAAVQTWLRDRLEFANSSADIDWIFLSWHVPPFTGARGRGDNDVMKNNTLVLLHEFNVDAVFLGHDHNYQRVNITRTSSYNTSVCYIITGGGGASLRDIEEPNKTWNGTDATGEHGEKYFGQIDVAESVYHFLTVSVNGTTTTITAIRMDGTVLDTFSLAK